MLLVLQEHVVCIGFRQYAEIVCVRMTVREMAMLSGEATVKLFYLPSGKGSNLKGKNLLSLGANSFLLEYTPFQKGIDVY